MKNLDNCINNNKVYFIAEMSANHGGSLERALSIVHTAKTVGAHAIKLQTYTADTMTLNCRNELFQNKGGLWDGTYLYDLYKSAETPWEWHELIKDECEKLGLDFFSTPFDLSAVDYLAKLECGAYKIASFELTDLPLIRYAARQQKPMIMSTGIANEQEIKEAIEACYAEGNRTVYLLKCCSCYPTEYEDLNLLQIPYLQSAFKVPIGLSDHSAGSLADICAVSLGACIIEKHLCLDRSIKTPDSDFSMEPKEFAQMIRDVNNAKAAMGSADIKLPQRETRQLEGRRSIFACRAIEKGEPFSKDNIRIVRPAFGLAPKYYDKLLGSTAPCDFKFGDPIPKNILDR